MTELTTPQPTEEKPDFLSRPLLASLNIDWEKAIYILFIVIAIVSRFYALGDRVMSHDESLHTQFSYQFYNGDGFNHTPLMHGPFLFHITALSYWLFGDNDMTARIPVAIFGVILVLVPYFLRNWIGRVGGLFASFIFLISPFIVYYSRYIRHDIYVIMWALIVFLGSWYYFHKQKDKYLWWFAAGLALMFATKEVAFIYVAIFGSWTVLRLAPQVLGAPWFRNTWGNLKLPILIAVIGLLLAGGGFVGQKLVAEPDEITEVTTDEPFASDPSVDPSIATDSTQTQNLLGWVIILGGGVLSFGLFLGVRQMRPFLDNYPEFDLIMLYTTLILPMLSPMLVIAIGKDPLNYTINQCVLPGQEGMNALQLAFTRMFNMSCWSAILNSPAMITIFFVVLLMAVGLAVGVWWNRRRWLISALIFYSLFTILYTSVFTNPQGFGSGIVGSLGYWMEQQEVQRGNQPWFYYFFIVPFYEFLPLIFSLLSVRLWLEKERLNKIFGYWIIVFLLSLFGYSLTNWAFNIQNVAIGVETVTIPGMIVRLLIIGIGILYWFFRRQGQLQAEYESGLLHLFTLKGLLHIVPLLTWWLILTWWAYSYAGEKMPWLSTHFVIPMAFLAGWYFNEKLTRHSWETWKSRPSLLFLGVTTLLIIVVFAVLSPILQGSIRLGSQELAALSGYGRFLGGIIVVAIVIWLWQKTRDKLEDKDVRTTLVTLSFFILLSLLTIRFAYMASFPNKDSVREFMVYAHGAPAAKSVVLDQLETMTKRLNGDNGLNVAFGGSGVSWPFTWYMREYPNRQYFGENPTGTLADSPMIIVGRSNWDDADRILGPNYDYNTYTYLWWPMEDYRNFSWNALLGDPNTPEGSVKRGLLNPDVRQSLWDIFFYRDYEKYGQTFGGVFTDSQWPLRDELRLYIRKDTLAKMWDYGIEPLNVSLEAVTVPFEEGQLDVSPALILNASGVPGIGEEQLFAPRNVTVADDGTIYVLDSGNQRVQVYDADGTLINSWGEPGSGNGQFSPEGDGPWGIGVTDEFVYVADTWNHRIQQFTRDGEFVAVYGQHGDPLTAPNGGLGLFFGPRNILIGDDGLIYINDTGHHRIQIMDTAGNFIGQIGLTAQFGGNPGEFYEPVGVAQAPDGSMYVTDTWNGRVQRVTGPPSYFPVGEWPIDGWATNFSIYNKPYVATDSAGRVYVTDPEQYRVLIFDPDGNYLGKFGEFGTAANNFSLPNGIFIDSQDNIYVADAGNNRVLKYPPIFPAFVQPAEELPQEEEEQPAEEESMEEPAEEEMEEEAVDEVEEDVEDVENVEEEGNTAVDESPTPAAEE